MANRHLQHIRSSVANKAPKAGDLLYGEIGVNYAKGSETLYLKNSNDEIIPFYNGNQYIETEETIAQALTDLDKRINEIDIPIMTEVTYDELRLKYVNGELKPGMYYRITDYVTYVNENGGIKSAKHPFDIIVFALSETELSEDAKAISHLGETYFKHTLSPTIDNCTLWTLKYTIINDSTKYDWCYAPVRPTEYDSKGVIYYMKDENGNEAPYDFKNIMFKRKKIESVDNTFKDDVSLTISKSLIFSNEYKIDEVGNPNMLAAVGFDEYSDDQGVNVNVPYGSQFVDDDDAEYGTEWYYTFSGILITDYSVDVNTSTITVNDYQIYDVSNSQQGYLLHRVGVPTVIAKEICANNVIKECIRYNTLDSSYTLPGNVFIGIPNAVIEITDPQNPSLRNESWLFNKGFTNIVANSIGFDSQFNTFVGSTEYNSLGEGCSYNVFGTDSSANKLMAYCSLNVLSNSCYNNTLGNNSSSESFGEECVDNVLGNYNTGNVFDAGSIGNVTNEDFGNNWVSGSYNTFGSYSHNNYFICAENVFGPHLEENRFGYIDINTTPYTYKFARNNIAHGGHTHVYVVGDSNHLMPNSTQFTLPFNANFVTVLSGEYGTNANQPTINVQTNSSYPQYVGKDSNGNIVIWNPADHVIPQA